VRLFLLLDTVSTRSVYRDRVCILFTYSRRAFLYKVPEVLVGMGCRCKRSGHALGAVLRHTACASPVIGRGKACR
jgi:hypothetical protein